MSEKKEAFLRCSKVKKTRLRNAQLVCDECLYIIIYISAGLRCISQHSTRRKSRDEDDFILFESPPLYILYDRMWRQLFAQWRPDMGSILWVRLTSCHQSIATVYCACGGRRET